MALRLRSSPRSSFGRNPRPSQLALEQVSSMLTPLRNVQTWLQERTAPQSVEAQLHESGLVIESDESIHDEQNLDESSNKSHGSQQSSEPQLRNVTIRTRERKNSPTQGEPTSSTKDESGKQEKLPSHEVHERGIRPTRGGRRTGRPTPGGGGTGGGGRISLGNRGGGRSSSSVGKATLHDADGRAVGVYDGHTHDGTKPLPKRAEKESRTDKLGKKSERRPESKKKSEKQRPPSPTSTLSGSDSGRTPSPPKRRNSSPGPPGGGGGGGSDGSNHKEEVRHEGDAVWLQLPRRSKPSGSKKVLPHKELQAVAKEMFDEAGNGVPHSRKFSTART